MLTNNSCPPHLARLLLLQREALRHTPLALAHQPRQLLRDDAVALLPSGVGLRSWGHNTDHFFFYLKYFYN